MKKLFLALTLASTAASANNPQPFEPVVVPYVQDASNGNVQWTGTAKLPGECNFSNVTDGKMVHVQDYQHPSVDDGILMSGFSTHAIGGYGATVDVYVRNVKTVMVRPAAADGSELNSESLGGLGGYNSYLLSSTGQRYAAGAAYEISAAKAGATFESNGITSSLSSSVTAIDDIDEFDQTGITTGWDVDAQGLSGTMSLSIEGYSSYKSVHVYDDGSVEATYGIDLPDGTYDSYHVVSCVQ